MSETGTRLRRRNLLAGAGVSALSWALLACGCNAGQIARRLGAAPSPTPTPRAVVMTATAAPTRTPTRAATAPVARTATPTQRTATPTTAPAKAPLVTPTGAPATVTGKLCFPSEAIPEMTVYLVNMVTKQVTSVPIAFNQTTYTAKVPPGSYIAFAYTKAQPGMGGSYSPAVPCGLTTACTDHSPSVFQAPAGGTVTNIDICDWYSPESVPPRPNVPKG